ncbi:hypothetical protein ACTJJB_32470 [Chitinophaga sp. 22536]|uniref:hypothetical protein n=1 Tax=unclassified Chitinophaga TaxID=2619133 RepID=UPI003F834516
MQETIIPDDDGKGFVLGFEGGDVEFINPVDYYSGWQKKKTIALYKALLFHKNPLLAKDISEAFYEKHAEENWKEIHEKILKTDIPPTLLQVLGSKSKKEQEQLMKKTEFDAFQLCAFLFAAHDQHGYTFSNYVTEQLPKNVDPDELPLFIHVKEDGTVEKAGETTMSEGQLRAVVNFRRVVVAKFLDKGNEWHCFFVVYRSLRGEESWRGGQPHFHYISDKWGQSRDEVVAMFKGDRYPTTSVHIPYNEK